MFWFIALLQAANVAALPLQPRQDVSSSSPTWKAGIRTFTGFSNNSVDYWLGLHYAEGPVGSLRFRAPQPLNDTASAQSISTIANGKSCPQNAVGITQSLTIPESEISEDCLWMNVYRPSSTTNGSALPVLFHIPGGGWQVSSPIQFDATQLVQASEKIGKPIIVAVVSYRTNIFGFTGGADFPQEDLNAGLLDQLVALRFVKSHVAGIGGDPEKIMIHGQSAGSQSVGFHLHFAEEGLFRAAWMMSGTASGVYQLSPEFQTLMFDTVSAAAGCPDNTAAFSLRLDCLRQQPWQALLNASTSALFGPSRGGYISEYASTLEKNGNIKNKVPLLVTNTRDEGTIVASVDPYASTDQEASQDLSSLLALYNEKADIAGQAQGLLGRYPADPAEGCPYGTGNATFGLGSQYKRVGAAGGDLCYIAGTRLARSVYKSSDAPLWAYEWWAITQGNDTAIVPGGATHGTDLAGIFPLYEGSIYYMQPSLIQFLREAVLSFIYDPYNGPKNNATDWPQYGSNKTVLVVNNPNNFSLIQDDYRSDGISYIIDSIYI